ncbi:acyl-ACP--UDP-N-acetylglucosamine O-acyltransferase [Entomobacter blattae]|uniref:Acyl-[acyl-carrier-protein]--UDP-N-acetylglucosamine O-acyltransferase n=1 Tax=Entomobacter blattae TaxID=2762277 RepID=A0A7H1NSL5_9PROT|nr:acyl-ACP--UDP-N-acetylglucosamine O-acyltransferase [Entomobacter blattae]QNT78775.1 Acyl-[acyl-carrier-protein]--UDP-N-acetylglucosamine O-acyltransferase [Entomobacter blattae]
MAREIHPSSIVSSKAQIEDDVYIGPWCSVGPNVRIKQGARLIQNVVVDGHTQIGRNTVFYPFTTVGLEPQDLKYKGEPTQCIIGDDTVVRENVTIHRGTATGHGQTSVGNNCLIMANAHIAHDCLLGDRIIIVNNVVMGGHVHIDHDARVMGAAALHQFVRIGRGALIGGVCGVEADVIPYGSVLGNRARLVGLHWVWLKRNGVSSAEIHRMRQAFRLLFPRIEKKNQDVFEKRLEQVKNLYSSEPKINEIIEFIQAPSKRGLVRIAKRVDFSSEIEGAV